MEYDKAIKIFNYTKNNILFIILVFHYYQSKLELLFCHN